MNALAIIGCSVTGGLLGGVIGSWIGFREGGDFNFAPLIYGPVGMALGGLMGVIVGAVVFA